MVGLRMSRSFYRDRERLGRGDADRPCHPPSRGPFSRRRLALDSRAKRRPTAPAYCHCPCLLPLPLPTATAPAYCYCHCYCQLLLPLLLPPPSHREQPAGQRCGAGDPGKGSPGIFPQRNGSSGLRACGTELALTLGNRARPPLWRDGKQPSTPNGRQESSLPIVMYRRIADAQSHSCRRATMGSTLVARRAGSQQANAATRSRSERARRRTPRVRSAPRTR